MSFSQTYRTLRSGKTYDSHTRPEISTHKEERTVEAEIDANEGNEGTSTGFSPDKIEEKIKANLEPLQAQFFPLTKIID